MLLRYIHNVEKANTLHGFVWHLLSEFLPRWTIENIWLFLQVIKKSLSCSTRQNFGSCFLLSPFISHETQRELLLSIHSSNTEVWSSFEVYFGIYFLKQAP